MMMALCEVKALRGKHASIRKQFPAVNAYVYQPVGPLLSHLVILPRYPELSFFLQGYRDLHS